MFSTLARAVCVRGACKHANINDLACSAITGGICLVRKKYQE